MNIRLRFINGPRSGHHSRDIPTLLSLCLCNVTWFNSVCDIFMYVGLKMVFFIILKVSFSILFHDIKANKRIRALKNEPLHGS